MGISQTKQLKITAVNIRSVLVERTSTVNRLKLRKAVLQRRQSLQAERSFAEKKVESKGSKKGPMRSILGNVKGMVMPIGARIGNFFGSLVMGWVVTKLPTIIKSLKSAWDIAKPILSFAWGALKKAFGLVFWFLKPLLKVFGINKDDKTKKKVGGEEQEFSAVNADGEEIVINETEEETVDLEEPDNDTAEISSPETETPDLEPKDEGGSDSSAASSSPLSGVTPKGLVNGEKKGGGSEEKKRKLPLQSASTAINKIKSVSKDLKGNGKKKNVNTVVVPIEVSKSTGSSTGSAGGTLETPAPVMSSNNSENQRLP
tara:strand:+ start:3294 stop:4241 length:948 start_codon:yes stop_codon:yes gene_type:complete